jgi:mono/diheme cytochrome c family protein
MKLNLIWAMGAISIFLLKPGLAQDNAKVEKGEKIYTTYCETCHGENLVNSGQSFDLRKFKSTERPRFENSVQNGKGQMPPWKGVVSEKDMDFIWAYIRTKAYDK